MLCTDDSQMSQISGVYADRLKDYGSQGTASLSCLRVTSGGFFDIGFHSGVLMVDEEQLRYVSWHPS